MTMIVPAGNKNVVWSPEKEMVKTAATSVSQDIEDTNPLYVAAKKFLAAQAQEEANEAPEAKAPEAKPPMKDEGAAVVEIETPEGEKMEEEGKDKTEVAVEKIEEAVVELKDAVGMVDTAEDQEVEIEVDEVGAPKMDGFETSIPGKEESKGEIIVKSEPEACPCSSAPVMAKKEEKKEECKCGKKPCECKDKKDVEMEKAASSDGEFVKYAKLSAENRSKLANYWTKMLGFPKEYVALMTKDYEK